MNYFTSLEDTDEYIFSFLDYISILYCLESCKYLNMLLKKDSFWLRYINKKFKNNSTAIKIFMYYHPKNETFYDSCKLYYQMVNIEDCIKLGRIDAIKFMQTDELLPCMYDLQIACKYGKIDILEFFKNEYALLPTFPCEINKPDTDIFRPKKTYRHDLRGPIGKQGVQGPIGINLSYVYAYQIAIENDNLKLMQWLYNNGLLLPQNLLRLDTSNEIKEWAKEINQRDK